ncbi:MAG: VOC family protein [Dehalococcoidia bacterium]|nr:VOC family protein [Dehalococcoidia bacterium]
MRLESISAVTIAVRDMAASLEFYQRLGFQLAYGGPSASFTSLRAGAGFLNLILAGDYRPAWWGRIIFRVRDVDGLYRHCLEQGLSLHQPPSDASWGERHFHITDPDGHELSFAEELPARS